MTRDEIVREYNGNGKGKTRIEIAIELTQDWYKFKAKENGKRLRRLYKPGTLPIETSYEKWRDVIQSQIE